MPKVKEFRTLEEEIVLLQEEAKDKSLSISEILHVLSGKGRPLIVLLLCLPFCQPIQIPGFSTPFGIMIAFFGARMVFGKKIWLPAGLLQKKISQNILHAITDKTLYFVRKMKRWVHPRFPWLCHSSFMEKLNGFMILMLGIVLALPLPIPLSNLLAAWAILFIAFGVLEDDGLFVLVGYFLSFLTLLFFLLVLLTAKRLIQ